jgi:glycyl-tRNA synthetase beta chain
MREHQKYFPVVNEREELLPLFVAVNNTKILNIDTALSGHERVIRARLEDALFFFNKDKKQKLSEQADNLSGIIFQQRLGTMAEKSKRIVRLTGWLAQSVAPEIKTDAIRAAQLAKADLLTEMVGEFPSLQGIIGREYALLDGEREAVAVAIAEHYMPKRSGSSLAKTPAGAIVSIADRIDTLAGCFAIGEKPTGNKDSFGLRRLAIGLISTIRGHKFSISLEKLIEQAVNNYQETVNGDADVANELLDFIQLRFENELVSSGQVQEVVEAATTTKFDDIVDCVRRVEALENIRCLDSFVILAGSFKRIRNITKDNLATEVQVELFCEKAEKELYMVVNHVRDTTAPLIDKQLYGEALEVLLEMKKPVDTFFDEVMVMDKDESIRQNRLNLLSVLRELVLRIGDISKMHTG